MIKKLMILCLTSVLFACGGETMIVLTADGNSYESGKYSYDFGDIRISDSVSRNFVLKISGEKAENAKVACVSDYFKTTSVGSGDTVTVTVSNIPQSRSGFYSANIRMTAGTATFSFGVSARQTDTVPSAETEWPKNRTVSVETLSFDSIYESDIDPASWEYQNGAVRTENQIVSVPEGGSVMLPLTGSSSLGIFEIGIYPLLTDTNLNIVIRSFDSSVGENGYISVPLALSFSTSDWTAFGFLVTSERMTVFQGETVVADFPFSEESNKDLKAAFPMLSFGLNAVKGGFFINSVASYAANFAQEADVNRFIAEIGEKTLVFDKVKSYSFKTMTQEEYDGLASAGITVGSNFSFEPGKGVFHSTDEAIDFTSESVGGFEWDCIHLTVEWTSDYKPNLFMRDGSTGNPFGISFYKAAASPNCFLLDGEDGAWNASETDRTTSFSHTAGVPCLMGVYQDSTNMMTVFDDFKPYTFPWTGAKSFSKYTLFKFRFNNDASGKAGSLTVQDISFFKSRELTSN